MVLAEEGSSLASIPRAAAALAECSQQQGPGVAQSCVTSSGDGRWLFPQEVGDSAILPHSANCRDQQRSWTCFYTGEAEAQGH